MTEPLFIAARHDTLLAALDDADERARLERSLPAYLRQQRWFGGQTRRVTAVHLERWVPLRPVAAGGVLCHLAVADAAGITTEHLVPLRAAEATGERRPLEDALRHEAIRTALLALALAGGTLAGRGAELHFEPTGAIPPGDYGAGRVSGVEQSNTSIIYGTRAILKLYRRIAPGASPEVELGRYLTAGAAFPAVPRTLASATLRGADGYAADALIVQDYVANQGDGWNWALARARDAYAAAADVEALAGWLAAEAQTRAGAAELGTVTGELHAALYAATSPPLAPLAARTGDVRAWVRDLREDAGAAARAAAAAGLDRPGLRAALERARQVDVAVTGPPGQLIRVHGDYHLGQVLRLPAGFAILDFEGEPAKTLEQRRARQHPLVDVAGMARSWSYAARAAARDAGDTVPDEVVERWGALTRSWFVAAYWGAVTRAAPALLPADPGDRDALLAFFELRKALYELRYELDYRPEWAAIPAEAIERNVLVGSGTRCPS